MKALKNTIVFTWLSVFSFGRFGESCSDTGTTQIINLNITGDHYLDVYVDGQLVSRSVYPSITKLNINIGAKVLAVNCRASDDSSGWVGSIIASLSNGIVTDKQWKCTAKYEAGWNMANFDEYGWAAASEHGSNSHSSPVIPYGQKLDIAANAKFIWTTQQYTDKNIYCRREIVDRCNEAKQRFYTTKEEYKDKVLIDKLIKSVSVTSVLECSMRCLNAPNCVSFNFETRDMNTRRCELNQGKAMSVKELASRTGFQYFELFKAAY